MNMELPSWLGIVHAENVVFADKRAEVQVGERWNAHVNAAQLVLGFIQDLPPEELPALYDSRSAAPMIAAARILDSASSLQLRANEGNTDEEFDTGLSNAALSAMAYAILGNFPSAKAVVQRHCDLFRETRPVIATLLACATPALLGKLYPKDRHHAASVEFLDLLEFFLQTGDSDAETALRKRHLELRTLASDAFEESLWLSSSVALNQIILLSTARIFRATTGEAAGYWERLTHAGIKTLLPTQFLALTRTKLLQSGSNALISLPTSTGKTLLSEMAIVNSVGEGKIGIFVVPYVALGRQIARNVKVHLPDGWRLHHLFGGYSEPVELDTGDERNFVVATPERLDVLLRLRPDLINRIDCVVFDEAHIIENGDRGMRVESLIARLLLRQSAGVPLRIILVSAVIPNTDVLAKWVGVRDELTIVHDWSSSSRRIALWHGGNKLTWFHSGDPLTPDGFEKFKPIASISLPWPHVFIARTGAFAEIKVYEQQDSENVAYLINYFWEKYNEPVLCVCATKDMTRRVAASVKQRLPAIEKLGPHLTQAIALITDRHSHCLHLRRALEVGVAYHNASLPHDLRAAIEDAAAEKELRVVVATTTLAEGIDLPFRVTVLADWLGYKNERQEPLAPLLVRNIAGRCGRAGKFTEGDVVVYDSPLGDPAYKLATGKAAVLKRTLFSEGDSGISSAANSEFASQSVRGVIASQFLAGVVENPNDEHYEDHFYSHLFASKTDANKRIRLLIDEISKSVTAKNWLLASRNSPLQITELGRAVNNSGFSPSSSRLIAEALSSASKGASPTELVAFLLATVGDIPEQSNAKFRKLVDHAKQSKGGSTLKKGKPKLSISITDLPMLIERWLQGKRPIEMFAELPAVARSKRKPPFGEWLAGLPDPTSWDDQFDKFCDFLNSVFFEFVPWLLRACNLLSPHLREKPQFEDWSVLGDMFRRDSDVTNASDFKQNE